MNEVIVWLEQFKSDETRSSPFVIYPLNYDFFLYYLAFRYGRSCFNVSRLFFFFYIYKS